MVKFRVRVRLEMVKFRVRVRVRLDMVMACHHQPITVQFWAVWACLTKESSGIENNASYPDPNKER